MEGTKNERFSHPQDKEGYPDDFANLLLELGQLEIRVKSRKKKLSPDLEKELDESFDKLIQGIIYSHRSSDAKWKKDLKLLRETTQEMEDIHAKEEVLPDELKAPREQRKNMFNQRISAFREKMIKISGCMGCINAVIETMENDFNSAHAENDDEREKSCWHALIGFENMEESELRNINNMMNSYETKVNQKSKNGSDNNFLH